MKNTITAILSNYNFVIRSNKSLYWGTGSLVWGYTAEVKDLGNDLYEINYHHWSYDEWGEPMVEETTKTTLHGALALQFLFERLPLFR